MTRRSKVWLVVASIFTLINIGSAGVAAAAGEGLHTAAHVVLTLVGAYFVLRLTRRAPQPELSGATQAAERLDRLQNSVDAVAIEVERIGEAQRFATKLATERAEAAPPKRP